MGRAKEEWMSNQYRGFHLTRKSICRNCLDNPDLRRFAYKYRTMGHCDYCGKKLNTVVSLDSLIEDAILPGIEMEYGDPSVYNIFDEGEYLANNYSTNEVVEVLLGSEQNQLKNDIINSITQVFWVCKYACTDRDEMIYESIWIEFTELVKKQTRFLFHENKSVSILSTIKCFLESVGSDRNSGLFKIVKPGTRRLYRARIHSKEELKDFYNEQKFGPPPVALTKTLRMSAEGISIFYCAYEEETALEEIKNYESDVISIGSFSLGKEICILDLTRVSSLQTPGFFNVEKRGDISKIQFLKSFVIDISMPVSENPGIEYVPTQIVTEYLRYNLTPPELYSRFQRIDGIVYPSSKITGGHCLVLFMDYDSFMKGSKNCYVDKKSFQCNHYFKTVAYRKESSENDYSDFL